MAGEETSPTEGESNGEGIYPRLRPARLEHGPARWLSALGMVLAVFPMSAGLNGQLAFPVWSSALILGFLIMGIARIWDATKREKDVARERSVAILAIHIGITLLIIGLVAPDNFRTVTRLAASGIGTSFVALGYFWNRRLRQARDAVRADERLRSLKHRAAYRVAQLTYGLIVLGILLVLVVEPTASFPLVPLLVASMLVGALSYAAFYGYYEVQY